MNNVVVLFPGQGSQEQNMGRDIAEALPEAMDMWKKAEKISNLPLREIYWESDDAAMQADTRNLQPALTVVNLSCWLALAGKINPIGAAGHSLGEYAAVAASGALSVEEVLHLVALRGNLMAEADRDQKGGMAALLKLSLEQVETLVKDVVKETGMLLGVANYNTPVQFVISGEKEAISISAEKAKEAKGRAIPLAVSGAFHSPLMENAAKELSKMLSKLSFNRPKFPIYCNVTAKPVADGPSLKEIMMLQMTSSVRWIDTIGNQWNDGARTFVEVGPKAVLTKMVSPILSAKNITSEEYSAVSTGSFEAIQALL